jgi:hypothetical protein
MVKRSDIAALQCSGAFLQVAVVHISFEGPKEF